VGDALAQRAHPPDDLMPGRNRQHHLRQFTIDDMQIGTTDRTGTHGDLHFSDTGRSRVKFTQLEGLCASLKSHGVHAGDLSAPLVRL
jgi:hypothetical protein